MYSYGKVYNLYFSVLINFKIFGRFYIKRTLKLSFIGNYQSWTKIERDFIPVIPVSLNGLKQKVYRRTMAGRQKCTGRQICEQLFKYAVKLIQIECNDCFQHVWRSSIKKTFKTHEANIWNEYSSWWSVRQIKSMREIKLLNN